MVDLPGQVPSTITSVEAPRSQLSPGELESPYFSLGRGLDKIGEGLETASVHMAEQAGFKAVSYDGQGNPVVQKAPIIGEAASAYARAAKFTALAQGEAESKRKEIEISRQFQNDPDGYARAAQAYRDELVSKYTSAAGPEVGISLGRAVDDTITRSYRWLVLEQQRTIKENFDRGTKAAMDSRAEDVISLIQSGALRTPDGIAAVNKLINGIHDISNERHTNGALQEDPEVGKLRLKGYDEAFGAAMHSDVINRLLKDPENGLKAATEYNDNVWNDKNLPPSQRAMNYAHGLATIKEFQQNAERGMVMQAKEQHARDQLFESAVINDSALPPDQRKVTENGIKTASGVSPESQMRMLAWVRRENAPETAAEISSQTAKDLFSRIFLPDGDPKKLTSLDPIRDAYSHGSANVGLNVKDEQWLEKVYTEAKSPQGETLSKTMGEFVKGFEHQIDKSNPMMGIIDKTGGQKLFEFQRFVKDQVDAYRAAGKNPDDLFNPDKPDVYLGRPGIVQKFQKTLQESTQEGVRRLTGQPPPGAPPGTPARTVPQRQPGESAADFDKRTGR